MAPDAPVAVPLGARCASHPDASAVALCARCGTFLCGACTELRGEGAYCAACVEVLKREAPPSRAVQLSIGLSIVGIVSWPVCMGLPVFALLAAGVGLPISLRELRRIRRGEVPPRGRTRARVALVLACINVLPVLLMAAVFAGFLFNRPV